ncbi:hypothetical protein LZ30DRAFT_455847 [Colletotrichum cereale]|nr:hypothetical protein LZ30DRAFT_455847 [Colletotrichum cereale]
MFVFAFDEASYWFWFLIFPSCFFVSFSLLLRLFYTQNMQTHWGLGRDGIVLGIRSRFETYVRDALGSPSPSPSRPVAKHPHSGPINVSRKGMSLEQFWFPVFGTGGRQCGVGSHTSRTWSCCGLGWCKRGRQSVGFFCLFLLLFSFSFSPFSFPPLPGRTQTAKVGRGELALNVERKSHPTFRRLPVRGSTVTLSGAGLGEVPVVLSVVYRRRHGGQWKDGPSLCCFETPSPRRMTEGASTQGGATSPCSGISGL